MFDDWIPWKLSDIYQHVKSWIAQAIERVVDFILDFFQPLIDDIINKIIEILPAELSTFSSGNIGSQFLYWYEQISYIIPLNYGFKLILAYINFKGIFWIIKKCASWFGLITPTVS